MTITATFSNGHTDTYKGSRDVKAAWMLIEIETGKVIKSGHSMTAASAEKTAKSWIPVAASLPTGWKDFRKSLTGANYAIGEGYKSIREMEKDYKKMNAEKAKQYKVEVVAL